MYLKKVFCLNKHKRWFKNRFKTKNKRLKITPKFKKKTKNRVKNRNLFNKQANKKIILFKKRKKRLSTRSKIKKCKRTSRKPNYKRRKFPQKKGWTRSLGLFKKTKMGLSKRRFKKRIKKTTQYLPSLPKTSTRFRSPRKRTSRLATTVLTTSSGN